MNPPACGGRKLLDILCLGFLAATLPFSGCVSRQTMADRAPTWMGFSDSQPSPVSIDSGVTPNPNSTANAAVSAEPNAAAERFIGNRGRDRARVLPPPPTIPDAVPSEATIASHAAIVTDSRSSTDMSSPTPKLPDPPILLVSTESASTEAKPTSLRSPDRHLELARTAPHPEPKLARGTVLHVDEDTFEQQVLRSDVPVLVDFHAAWCGPCKTLAPAVEQVAAENPLVKVVKVNVDDNPRLAARYGVKSLPSLMVFRDGRIVAKQQGVVAKKRLEAMLTL